MSSYKQNQPSLILIEMFDLPDRNWSDDPGVLSEDIDFSDLTISFNSIAFMADFLSTAWSCAGLFADDRDKLLQNKMLERIRLRNAVYKI